MARRALTPRDLLSLKTPIDAQVSPDGMTVVYVAQENPVDEDKPQNSLWLLRLDQPGDAGFRLTSHPTDAFPRWSPDGSRLAFVSRRNDKAQIYIIKANGGEAELQRTDQAPSSTPLWSPDGRKIAFKAMVDRTAGPRYPGEPAELAPKSKEDVGKEDAKQGAKVQVITDINYRADGKGMIHRQFAQLFVLNLEDGQCQQVTTGEERIGDFIWSQNSSALLYLVEQYDQAKVRQTTAVRQVDIDSLARARVLEFDGTLNRLDLSPTGRWLLISGTDNAHPQGTGISRLWALDLNGQSLPLDFAQAVCVTAQQEVSCLQAHWDSAGSSIYFLQQQRGSTKLLQVPFQDGLVGQVVDHSAGSPATITHYDLAEDGTLVCIASSFTEPPDLYLLTDESAMRLTDLNKSLLQDCELCAAEKFAYKGADDWEIEGWLVRPLNCEPGRRYPTVLSVHGGPTGAYYDSFQFPFQLLAHQGFAVVFTNPRGSVTYGSEFARGCVNDLGGRDWQDINAGLDRAIELGVVDGNRVGIMGWSYGGFMTCWAVTQTNRFKAAVGGANISNWYTLYGCSDSHIYAEGLWSGPAFDKEERMMQQSPIRHVRRVETPILLLHGESDIRCPIGQSEQFFTALKRLNKEAVFVRYPGQFHGLVKPSYVLDRWLRTVAWFKHYLS